MTTQRRSPSGQGPSRRPGPAARTRTTGSMRQRPRPTVARRTVNVHRGTTKRTVAARPRALTTRAMALIAVFVALALAYTYPIRVYLAQESQIAQLEADNAANEKAIKQKTQALQKWKDPAYIKAQAKERLHYVEPGDVVLFVPQYTKPQAASGPQAAQTPAAQPDPWYDTLWNGVRAADAQPS